jgi:hypothetical protein
VLLPRDNVVPLSYQRVDRVNPTLGFVEDELAEVGLRTGEHDDRRQSVRRSTYRPRQISPHVCGVRVVLIFIDVYFDKG